MDKHIYSSIVPYGYVMSITEKRTLNLHLQEEICKYLTDLSKKKMYLQHSWYDLEYLTHALHAVYQLFYKMISVLGTPGMASKCKYHHLVHGPHKINTKLEIYSCLLRVIDVQIGIMGALVRQSSTQKCMTWYLSSSIGL